MAATEVGDLLRRRLMASIPFKESELADSDIEQLIARLVFNPALAAELADIAEEYSTLIPGAEHDLTYFEGKKVICLMDFSEIYTYVHRYARSTRFGSVVYALLQHPPKNVSFGISPFTTTEWLNYYKAVAEGVASIGRAGGTSLRSLISQIKSGKPVADSDSRLAEVMTPGGRKQRIAGPTEELLSYLKDGTLRVWSQDERRLFDTALPDTYRLYFEDALEFMGRRGTSNISDDVDALNAAYVRWLNDEFGNGQFYIMLTRQLLRTWFLQSKKDEQRQARHSLELLLLDYSRRMDGKDTLRTLARALALVAQPLRPLADAARVIDDRSRRPEFVPSDWALASTAVELAREDELLKEFCSFFEDAFGFLRSTAVDDYSQEILDLEPILDHRKRFCEAVERSTDDIRRWATETLRAFGPNLDHPELQITELTRLRDWLTNVTRL